MDKTTTKKKGAAEQKRNLENIISLQSLRDKLSGADLGRLDEVIGDLRKSVGDTVSKSNAAEMLHVSRQTLDKWVREDVLPTVRGENGRQQIPRQVVEKLTEEVRSLRDTGQVRATLSKALHNLADELYTEPKKKQKAEPVAKQETSAEPKAQPKAEAASKDKPVID